VARTLGILFTWTTYGKWLRGDARGWVDEGKVFPRNQTLMSTDRRRLRYSPFVFPRRQRHVAGHLVGKAVAKLGGEVYALCVASWHIHLVTGYVHVDVSDLTKTVKETVRTGLAYRRAIWAQGFDKRFCFDVESLANRIRYARRHNLEDGLPADPWPFIHLPPLLKPLVP